MLPRIRGSSRPDGSGAITAPRMGMGMEIYIAPDPTTEGAWVLDDLFHFLGGSDEDQRNLEAAISDAAAAKARRGERA